MGNDVSPRDRHWSFSPPKSNSGTMPIFEHWRGGYSTSPLQETAKPLLKVLGVLALLLVAKASAFARKFWKKDGKAVLPAAL